MTLNDCALFDGGADDAGFDAVAFLGTKLVDTLLMSFGAKVIVAPLMCLGAIAVFAPFAVEEGWWGRIVVVARLMTAVDKGL